VTNGQKVNLTDPNAAQTQTATNITQSSIAQDSNRNSDYRSHQQNQRRIINAKSSTTSSKSLPKALYLVCIPPPVSQKLTISILVKTLNLWIFVYIAQSTIK
jgi:hypothetical protein